MRRREFIKKAAVATGGVVIAPFPDLHRGIADGRSALFGFAGDPGPR